MAGTHFKTLFAAKRSQKVGVAAERGLEMSSNLRIKEEGRVGGKKAMSSDNIKLRDLEHLITVIERAKKMWQSTFDAIRDPVVIISDNFDIERANLTTAGVAGIDIKDIIGKKCYKAFAEKNAICEGCPLLESIESNRPSVSKLAHQIHKKDFEVSAYPYPGGEVSSHAAVLHYRDITEEKRLQQEVIQQEKMAAIGMLAGGVAHEINNPLGGILAFTQLMIRDPKINELVRGDLTEIEAAAKRCKKIISNLLDFSRVSSGKEKQPLDVSVLIEKLVPIIRAELRSLNVSLKLNLGENLPKICGDANRLQQVFLNLITNACQAMPKGGDLSVRTFANGLKICVEVADTGCGIPKDILPKIFDPFFTTKGPGRGTGLGLSISYRIVREHEGTIRVETEINKGTRFKVCLPAAKEIL